MSPMHDLVKQVFVQFIFDNKQIDWMREALRLMQPIGTCADDEQVLVTALASARSDGKSVASVFYDLHSVNSHAENIWNDYYLLHKHRLDALVDSCMAAEPSSASPSSGSFSDEESLSAASSPPTSVEDVSDLEDKGSPSRDRLPSAAPEEPANSTPPSRATSPTRLPSPDVPLEQYLHLDILLEEDRASLGASENPEATVGSDPTDDPTVDATVPPYSDAISTEMLLEPMVLDEDTVDFNEAVTQSPSHSGFPSSPEPSGSVRHETPSPSLSATDSPPPQTPSPSRPLTARTRWGRRGRGRKSKKRQDDAMDYGIVLKPSSTASTSSSSSLSLPEPIAPPVRSKFFYAMSEEMGRAGSKATLGDIKACVRYLIEHPDVASMKCDRRGKEFSKSHTQRTAKAWSHIFTRFDAVIEDLAETYRLSDPS